MDLAPLLKGSAGGLPGRVLYAEATTFGPEQKALIKGDHKLIYTPVPWDSMTDRERALRNPLRGYTAEAAKLFRTERTCLYDLAQDPQEERNLAASHPALLAEYMAMMRSMLERNAALRQSYQGDLVDLGKLAAEGRP